MKQIHSEFNGMIADSTSMLDEDQLSAFESALWAVADEVAKRTAGNA